MHIIKNDDTKKVHVKNKLKNFPKKFLQRKYKHI